MKFKSLILVSLVGLTLLSQSLGFAADLTSVAGTIITQLKSLAQLLSLAAYVAGIGLMIVGIMKFKAHKDNPTQEPLGKAVTVVLVAGSLLFLPTVMDVASQSLFGAGAGKNASSFTVGS